MADMSGNKERYTELFLDEAAEHIENLNTNLLALEKDHSDPEIINEIFRSAHTLKSSAAFVGLDGLSHLAHKMEDLFQKVRDGSISVNTKLVNLFFACLDRIKEAVSVIQEGKTPSDNYQDLVAQIEAFHEDETTKPQSQPAVPSDNEQKPDLDADKEGLSVESDDTKPVRLIHLTQEQKAELLRQAGTKPIFHGYVLIDDDAPMKNMRFLLLLNKLARVGTIFLSEPSSEDFEDGNNNKHLLFIYYGDERKENLFKTCQVDMVEEVHITEIDRIDLQPEVIQNIQEGQAAQQSSVAAIAPATAVETKLDIGHQETYLKTRNIKVSSDKIDYLLNNVGELVITNSGLLKIYEDLLAEFGDATLLGELKSRIDQAGRIARDLQTGIMKTRMIPVGIVFQRFSRPVRDIALSLDKEIELHIEGEDTELDKNIIDALNDPLLHLIRNALDHGIETPQDRKLAGKDPIGHITLKAYQSGNSIYVEIKDDGRGLNRQKILDKAIEKGLVAANSNLSDDEIFNLIFMPGFSTVAQVSDMSGRGVGMNVVRKMVGEFKGTVQIQNSPGHGTAFILTFPLTLAIISAILVRVAGEDYAFPLSDVVETIRVTRSEISRLQGKSIINLRNEIVPIFHLGRLMGLPETETEEFPVVIASIANRKIGYIVEEMVGKKEIVIKSLEQNYRRVDGLIGACLMGDGSIVMVLDVHSLMNIANRMRHDIVVGKDSAVADSVVSAIRLYNDRVKELSWAARKLRRKDTPAKQVQGRHKEVAAVARSAEPATVPSQNGQSASLQTQVTQTTTVLPSTHSDSVTHTDLVVEELPQTEAKTDSFDVTPTLPELKMPAAEATSTVLSRHHEGQAMISDEQVQQSIESFKQEKEDRLDEGLQVFGESTIGTENGSLSDDDYHKLYAVINTGMINGGLVLSQLLGVTVEVTVPEFQTIHYHEVSKYLPGSDSIGVFLETEGDFHALLMLVFDEETGYSAAGELMGISVEDRNKSSMDREDVQSVLSELTNIVGSSLLNELANRTGLSITPTVPHFIHGTAADVVKYIDSKEAYTRDSQFIYISTDFLREDTELLGRMFMLPNRPGLLELVRRI